MELRNGKAMLGVWTIAVLLLTLVSVGETCSYAATLKVPGSYATIQEAIDAASAGDTIKIAKGKYTENIVVDKSLTIRGKKFKTSVRATDNSSPAVTVTADNVELKQFDIRGGSIGLVAKNVDRLKLQSLRVRDSEDDGIYLFQVDNVFINKCKAYDNESRGIVLEVTSPGAGGKIKKCRAYRNGFQGIVIQQGQGTRVDSCRAYGNGFDGIFVFGGDGIRLVKNRCSNNATGMFIGGFEDVVATVNAVVENNVFENNSDAGFQVQDSQGVASRNVSKNNVTGFLVDYGEDSTTDWLFKDNSAEKNSEDGFLVQISGNAFDGNKSTDNQRHGFYLRDDNESGGSLLDDNLSSGNGGHGFLVENGNPPHQLVDNRALSNGGDGFHAVADAAGTTFADNFSDNNNGFGFVDNGANTFEGNTCGGNNAAGSSNPVGLCD